MKLFGFEVTRTKAGPPGMSGITPSQGGWWPLIREPFGGAWQRDMEIEALGNLTAFSAVYACIALIAGDISKLRVKLMEHDEDAGIWTEVRGNGSPFHRVLRKPNRYQTRIQFISYWIVSKLLYGNAYILKERADRRGMVTALYVLDPRLVTPLVADDGSVWYQLGTDRLSQVTAENTFAASEIIHDRCVCLYHPLLGVSPIYAAAHTATQGIRIQANSEKFFANMSAPSGHLSAPGRIDDMTANRMRNDFETAKGGANLGRLLVTGDGMKYEPFSMPAVDSQLIEQLRWTIEDVARCFGVPLHKIQAGQVPQVGNMAALDQAYYAQPLQPMIEAAELLLDEGLELENVEGKRLGVEFDLEGLLRMDPISRADRLEKLRNYIKPNEGRASENYPPVEGGNSVYRQQQEYSLEAMAKRDAKPDPFATGSSAAPTATPAPAQPTAEPAANDAAAAKWLRELADGIKSLTETADAA